MKFPFRFTYRNLHGFARFPGDSTALVFEYTYGGLNRQPVYVDNSERANFESSVLCELATESSELPVSPGLWNSLPSHLKDADISYSEFRRSLKTFLFGQSGHGTV